ncbi:MAG: VOC family protein [Acidimicrobiales bacterium]
MSPALNHTIVPCRNKKVSSDYLVKTLGLGPAAPFGPFLVAELGNGVSLDFRDVDGDITSQHYAFLVTEAEFDDIFGRIKGHQDYWADPFRSQPSEINDRDGGRGVYFEDPDGHFLEILTRPYGSGG